MQSGKAPAWLTQAAGTAYATHLLRGSDKGRRHAGVLVGWREGGRLAVGLRLGLDVGGRRGALDGPAQLPRKALPVRSCDHALTGETGNKDSALGWLLPFCQGLHRANGTRW